MNFHLEKKTGYARAGRVITRRGEIPTPFFFSVGTQAAIKGAVEMEDLQKLGAPALLCNTYHMALRPGFERVKKLGGLHEFAKWPGPILTDSGGFQVFSLGQKKITEDGVTFRSHINGDKFYLDAETSMQVQLDLDADIIMAFDYCPPNIPHRKKITRAVNITTQWAERCIKKFESIHSFTEEIKNRPQLFCIVQGGCFFDLRKKSLQELTAFPFDGVALGGLAVGETEDEMYTVLDDLKDLLPTEKPRYLMGVGTPKNILESISRGIDMFDCVLPLRNARHGDAFTWTGKRKIRLTKFSEDSRVLDESCTCPVCKEKKYSRAYLHHLFRTGEDLAKRLLSIHNIGFYHQLLRESRKYIFRGDFEDWKTKTLQRLEQKEG